VTTSDGDKIIHINEFLDNQRDTERPERPTWDQVWMETAKVLSRRSLDPRFQVGAVIVTDDNTQVLAVGYNGDHRGGPNSVESTEPGQSGFIHAEINALIKCDFNHPKAKKMYLTLSPCRQCAKAIINGGVREVVYLEEYRDTSGVKLLVDSGLIVRRYR
jgi:dCMP deaminase